MADQAWPAPDCAPLEERAYGPKLTPEERELVRAQIYVYAPGIIKMTEAPVLSPAQMDEFESKLLLLAQEGEEFQLLIDLTQVVIRPDAKERARLKQIFSLVSAKIPQCAVYTGKNFMLNMAAKFILGGLGFQSLTVHKKKEDALKVLGYES